MANYNIYNDVTRYIEDEAFRGRPVADVLDELRSYGWSEQHIHNAVSGLNEQHDVLQQVDLDPLHRQKKQRRNLKAILLSSLFALIITLVVFFVFINRPVNYTIFADPNFTMLVPENWTREDQYKPGSSVVFMYSSGQQNVEDGAFMTLYLNLFEDQFGRQLLTGDAGATILLDKTSESEGTTRRYVEYEQDGTLDSPQATRGAYVLVTRGQLTVSASIASKREHWGKHAESAEKILKSITPNCSIKNLDALYDADGAIFLCQNES